MNKKKQPQKLCLQELKLQSFATDPEPLNNATIHGGSVEIPLTELGTDCVISAAASVYSTKTVSVSFVASAGSVALESVVSTASAVSTVVSAGYASYRLGRWIGSHVFGGCEDPGPGQILPTPLRGAAPTSGFICSKAAGWVE